MKVEDIKYFFQEIKHKTLKELEKKRKTALYVNNTVTIGSVVLFLGFIVFIIGIFSYGKEDFLKKVSPLHENYTASSVEKVQSFFNNLSALTSISTDWLAIIFGAALALIAFLFYDWTQRRYIDAFKDQINKRLFSRLNSQIKYTPDKYISKKDFRNSHLFVDESFDYEGCDHCSLDVKERLIEFSEVKASIHKSTGKYSTTEIIYFHGLFMKLHLNLQAGFIGIIPKQKKKGLFSFLEDKKMNTFHGKQKLDLPSDFGQTFDVYCDDRVQAQQILTNDVKNNILQMHTQFDQNIYFSFQGSSVYIAVECGAFFEPPLKKSIQVEDLKKTALLLNSFVNSAESMIPLISNPLNRAS